MQYVIVPIGFIILLLLFTSLGFWSSAILGSILGIMVLVAPQTLVGIVICFLGFICYLILELIF